jgi:hypothetical protein
MDRGLTPEEEIDLLRIRAIDTSPAAAMGRRPPGRSNPARPATKEAPVILRPTSRIEAIRARQLARKKYAARYRKRLETRCPTLIEVSPGLRAQCVFPSTHRGKCDPGLGDGVAR